MRLEWYFHIFIAFCRRTTPQMPVQLGESRKSPENTEILPLDTMQRLDAFNLNVETNIAWNQADTDKVTLVLFGKKHVSNNCVLRFHMIGFIRRRHTKIRWHKIIYRKFQCCLKQQPKKKYLLEKLTQTSSTAQTSRLTRDCISFASSLSWIGLRLQWF